jgi:uncharacterized protein (DUF433 family)
MRDIQSLPQPCDRKTGEHSHCVSVTIWRTHETSRAGLGARSRMTADQCVYATRGDSRRLTPLCCVIRSITQVRDSARRRASRKQTQSCGTPLTIDRSCYAAELRGIRSWLQLLRADRYALDTPPKFGVLLSTARRPLMRTEQLPIHSDPEIMGGTPVFVGTRVPVQTLLEYLEAGDPLDEFLDDFPSVTRDQAVAVLELAKTMLLERATAA